MKATDPLGRRWVIQCKHRRSGARGAAVGTPDLQVLNGTARQVPGADVAVIVTNGRVTDPDSVVQAGVAAAAAQDARRRAWCTVPAPARPAGALRGGGLVLRHDVLLCRIGPSPRHRLVRLPRTRRNAERLRAGPAGP
ncbi:restriction endonuclease [Streptomyces flaveolus]